MNENGFKVEFGEFHAYRDHMSHTFMVTGELVIAGGGVAAELLPHQGPSGFNDRILPLDLVFTATGESPSEQTVEWKGDWDDDRYEEVEFRLKGTEGRAPSPVKVETLE